MIRTRFAPSPTGGLHLGNIRVAVFNWLLTQREGGSFVVRLEDTDIDRNVEGAEEAILEDLRWLGLEWTEGPDRGGPHGPYRQSEAGSFYRDAADRLLAAGAAYLSHDLPEDEEEEGREGGGPRPFRRRSEEEERRRAAAGIRPVVRFRVPDRTIRFRDEVRGEIEVEGREIGDFVLLRSDGRPTYNFAVVVDDVRMRITHVIRGVGHLSNTPRQVLLFEALEEPLPRFIHLPTVLGPDRKKLSKREGAEPVAALRERGFPPDAIVNYLSLLGWSSEDEEEFLTIPELIDRISVERLGSADTVFDPAKLRWLAGRHLGRLSDEEFANEVAPFVKESGIPLEGRALEVAVSAVRSHLSELGEIGEALRPLYPTDSAIRDGTAAALGSEGAGGAAEAERALAALRGVLTTVEPWREASIKDAIRAAGKDEGLKGPALFRPLRMVLTAEEKGPELGKVMEAIGREETLRRLDLGLDTLRV